MHVLEFILAGIVAFLVCGYFQLPIVAWSVVAAGFTWWLSALVGLGPTADIVLASVFVVGAAVLNIPLLRRVVFTNHVLAVYRRILPDMSSTEKEAIDAGTVWWDADLFSGKPDWNKMLAIPAPRLSAEEQAFLAAGLNAPLKNVIRKAA